MDDGGNDWEDSGQGCGCSSRKTFALALYLLHVQIVCSVNTVCSEAVHIGAVAPSRLAPTRRLLCNLCNAESASHNHRSTRLQPRDKKRSRQQTPTGKTETNSRYQQARKESSSRHQQTRKKTNNRPDITILNSLIDLFVFSSRHLSDQISEESQVSNIRSHSMCPNSKVVPGS